MNRVVVAAADKLELKLCSPALISSHEWQSCTAVAERIARLLHYNYAGTYRSESYDSNDPPYFVPTDTLLCAQAAELGINDESRLFGGCVPYPFVATKSISHGLINAATAAPEGWCPQFAEAVVSVVLPGYSAFSLNDAAVAARQLLKRGAVRIKPAAGRGGNDQHVVNNADEIDKALSLIDANDCVRCGVVLEQNLQQIVTSSVGNVTIGDMKVSYCGTQFTTTNARSNEVYGGSSLWAVRGDFDALIRCKLSSVDQLAVAQAIIYENAAHQHFAGLITSRRNYDIAQGFTRDGIFFSGVLEQSWRIGGASPAEIAALEAFADDPNITAVRASCREVYGATKLPANARVYFQGEDNYREELTKYAFIDSYEYFTQ